MNQNPIENGTQYSTHACDCRLHIRFLKQSEQECTIISPNWSPVTLWSQKPHCFINLKHSFQEVNRDCQQLEDNAYLLYTYIFYTIACDGMCFWPKEVDLPVSMDLYLSQIVLEKVFFLRMRLRGCSEKTSHRWRTVCGSVGLLDVDHSGGFWRLCG